MYCKIDSPLDPPADECPALIKVENKQQYPRERVHDEEKEFSLYIQMRTFLKGNKKSEMESPHIGDRIFIFLYIPMRTFFVYV